MSEEKKELKATLFKQLLSTEEKIYKNTEEIKKKYDNFIKFLKDTLLKETVVSKRKNLVEMINKTINDAVSSKKIIKNSDTLVRYIEKAFFDGNISGIITSFENNSIIFTFEKNSDVSVSFFDNKDFTTVIKYIDISRTSVDDRSDIYKNSMIYNSLINNERKKLFDNFKTIVEKINEDIYNKLYNSIDVFVKDTIENIDEYGPLYIYNKSKWESNVKEFDKNENRIKSFLEQHVDDAESGFKFKHKNNFENFINDANNEFSNIEADDDGILLNEDKTIKSIIIKLDEFTNEKIKNITQEEAFGIDINIVLGLNKAESKS